MTTITAVRQIILITTLCLGCLPGHSQEVAVRIRLVDARNGHAIGHAKRSLIVQTPGDERTVLLQRTDPKGFVIAHVPKNSTIRVFARGYAGCAGGGVDDPQDYALVADALKVGIVSANQCSRLSAPRSPGTIVVFMEPSARERWLDD